MWAGKFDLSDWLVGRVVDFAPGWSGLDIEDTHEFGGRGKAPECDRAVLVGLAHRTEDPLGTVREFLDKVKAEHHIVHFLVRRDPKTPELPTRTLVEPLDALQFKAELGERCMELHLTAPAKRYPTEWYMLIGTNETKAAVKEPVKKESVKESVKEPVKESVPTRFVADVKDDAWMASRGKDAGKGA